MQPSISAPVPREKNPVAQKPLKEVQNDTFTLGVESKVLKGDDLKLPKVGPKATIDPSFQISMPAIEPSPTIPTTKPVLVEVQTK